MNEHNHDLKIERDDEIVSITITTIVGDGQLAQDIAEEINEEYNDE